MKKIFYTRPNGGLSIVSLIEGARLCSEVMINIKQELKFDPPVLFRHILQTAKNYKISPVWAETEEAFIERFRKENAPPEDETELNPPPVDFKLLWGFRLCSGAVLSNKREVFETPVPFDRLEQAYGKKNIAVIWAETEEEFLARIMAKDVPEDATDVKIVDESAIPADRSFRDAWIMGENGVEHDMVKARDIVRDRIREARRPRLQQLDVEYLRADEKGDAAEKKRIAAEKQALRDLTDHPAIETALTVEELKEIKI